MSARRPGGTARRRHDAAERARARLLEDRALTERVRLLAAQGCTAGRIATELGTYRQRVAVLASAAGVELHRGVRLRAGLPDTTLPDDQTPAGRRAFAVTRFAEGYTLASIGRALGVSKQRAGQLVRGRQN